MRNSKKTLFCLLLATTFALSLGVFDFASSWSVIVVPVSLALYLKPNWKSSIVLGSAVLMGALLSNGMVGLFTAAIYELPLVIFLTFLSVRTNLKQFIDPLTKAFNRGYYNQFTADVKNLKGLSMQVLDLDHFKNVNDTYGHNCGDFVLTEVVKIISDNVRKSDKVCRYGGEEFAILSPKTNRLEATVLAQRVCEAVEKHEFIYCGEVIPVTISVGVAFQKEEQTSSAIRLFELADKALFNAKKGGRNRIQVSVA